MAGPRVDPFKVLKALLDVESAVGDFIANGPGTGLPGWVRDKYRQRCNEFANVPTWAKILGTGSAASLGRICQPYYDDQGKDGPVLQVPFSGGQCPGRGYSVTTNVTFGGAPTPIVRTGDGPISLATQPSSTPGQIEAQVIANGVEILSVTGATAVVIVSITTIDGLPDTCGDPPGELEPGADPPADPGPLPGPEPTDNPDNPTGPPLLPVPPYDDPLGGPTPIEAPPGTDAGGSSSDSGQPGSGDNVGTGIPVDPETDDPETDFGTPPAGSIWVGCLLNFDFPPEVGNIADSGPENQVVPRAVGNASLVFSGGRGNAEVVRSAWQYLIRPTSALEVTGVFLNVLPGVTYIVYPVSVESCPPNQCEV